MVMQKEKITAVFRFPRAIAAERESRGTLLNERPLEYAFIARSVLLRSELYITQPH
jgi:hypothetical protein